MDKLLFRIFQSLFFLDRIIHCVRWFFLDWFIFDYLYFFLDRLISYFANNLNNTCWAALFNLCAFHSNIKSDDDSGFVRSIIFNPSFSSSFLSSFLIFFLSCKITINFITCSVIFSNGSKLLACLINLVSFDSNELNLFTCINARLQISKILSILHSNVCTIRASKFCF